jgi:Co/Zn/Cd efflux system component
MSSEQPEESEVARGRMSLRQTVWLVALLNVIYFGVEITGALTIGSVALFADSVDFLEDASVNMLIAVALSWSPRARARVGMILAGVLLIPSIATVWTAWEKVNLPTPPDPVYLSVLGAGALAVNLTCALMLARFRESRGSLTRAAFLSARNDAAANIAMVVAGVTTGLLWYSAWPDLIVGLGILSMNFDAAREVWTAARTEHRAASASLS